MANPILLAAALTDFSVMGVVLLIVNVIIGIVSSIVAFSVRRLVDRIDKIDDESKARLEGERKERVELERRLWELNADMKENYQTRREGLRQFGSLMQKLDTHRDEIMNKIDGLPCTQVACPGDKRS